ncbi:MAG: ThiF family adenylyltransferase [Clostridia bacterium]
MINNSIEENQYTRTRLLFGYDGVLMLNRASVVIIGIGGVGGSCAIALSRTGIGSIYLIDPDFVNITNLNRQSVALKSTIGMSKVDAMKRIIEDVSDAKVKTDKTFVTPENVRLIIPESCDFIIDACDTISAKIAIIELSKERGQKVISSMGAGWRSDPTRIRIADIKDTYNCPLARVMRKELKAREISGVKVVFSEEVPKPGSGASAIGSAVFVPNAFGLALASFVTTEIIRSGIETI